MTATLLRTRARRVRPGQLSTFLVTALAAVLPVAAAAQDCEVRYRAGGSSTWTFVTRNAGQEWSGTVNNLTEIQNAGGNDVVVRTSGIGGIVAENRLIANPGGGTIVLPPAVWTGLQLQRISCHSWATVYDATEYLETFGTSAVQLVQDAAATAQSAAQEAQQEAADYFGQTVQGLAGEAEELRDASAAAWQAYQDSVAAAAAQAGINLQTQFPELHQALEATADYTWGLPESTTSLWIAHVQGTHDAMVALDAELGVSATVQEVVSMSGSGAFPEIAALQSVACRPDDALLGRLERRQAQLAMALQELADAAAEAVWPADIADPLMRDLWGMAVRLADPPCADAAAGLARSLAADRAAMLAYVREVEDALRGVDVRALARGQEAFGTGLTELARSTTQLIALLVEQERLEQAVEFRATEVRQAQELLVGPDPVESSPGGVMWMSPAYWERRVRQGDADDLEAEAAALVTATERYEAAVRERGRGWDRVVTEWEEWSSEAANLGALVPGMRISVQGIDDLTAAVGSPPAIRTPARSLNELNACLEESLQRMARIHADLMTVNQRLFEALIDRLTQGLPPELANQLMAALEALQDVQRGLGPMLASHAAMVTASAETLAAMTDLAAALARDPITPGYLALVNQHLDVVSSRAERMADTRERADATFRRHFEEGRTLLEELERLAQVITPDMSADDLWREVEQEQLDLERDMEAARSGGIASLECAGGISTAISSAVVAHPQRAAAFTTAVASTVGNAALEAIPVAVRSAHDDALVAAAELIASFEALAVAAGPLASHAVEVAGAQATIQAALSPQLDVGALTEAVNTARQASYDLWMGSSQLYGAANQIQVRQTAFVGSLADLQMAMVNAGMQAAWNGAEIAYSEIDDELVSGEFEEAQFVAERWAAAMGATPGRVAALSGVDAYVSTVVTNALAIMDDRLGAMNQCLAEGIQARTALLANSLRTSTVQQALSGLESEAEDVMAELQDLLDPTQIMMGNLASVFETADALAERVTGMHATTASTFMTLAGTAVEEATDAAACIQSRYNQVNSQALQIQSVMSN